MHTFTTCSDTVITGTVVLQGALGVALASAEHGRPGTAVVSVYLYDRPFGRIQALAAVYPAAGVDYRNTARQIRA